MKKSVLLALMTAVTATTIHSQEQADSVRLEFYHHDDMYAERLAQFQGIYSLSFRLINEGGPKSYDLYAVKVSPDTTVESKISMLPITLQTDTVEVNMFAQAVDSASAKLAITPFSGILEIHQPTSQCLLIEALPKGAFAPGEEIPLAGYSTGRRFKVEIDGNVYDAYQICDVRQSGISVADWGREFDLPPYTYFTLKPKE